jgi:predicted nucleic acid-binding protein
VIVLDASAALMALLNDGHARQLVGSEVLHVPHVIDSEIAGGLRRQVRTRHLDADEGRRVLQTWSAMGVSRFAITGLLDRIWELRDNLTAYDASYVVLAEELNCALITADARLANAPGIRCAVTVVQH